MPRLIGTELIPTLQDDAAHSIQVARRNGESLSIGTPVEDPDYRPAKTDHESPVHAIQTPIFRIRETRPICPHRCQILRQANQHQLLRFNRRTNGIDWVSRWNSAFAKIRPETDQAGSSTGEELVVARWPKRPDECLSIKVNSKSLKIGTRNER